MICAITVPDGSGDEFKEMAERFNVKVLSSRLLTDSEVFTCEADTKVRVMIFAQAFFGQQAILQFVQWVE